MPLSHRLILLFLLVVAGGCSGAAAGGGSPSEELARVRLEGASDFEKEILEDLLVTQAEYERAVLATVDCVRDQFPELEIEGPYTSPNGFTMTFDYVAHTGNDPDSVDEFSHLVDEADAACEGFRAGIESVWVEQHIPSGVEREEMQQAFVDCADRVGLSGLAIGMNLGEVLEKVAEHNNRTQDGLAYDCLYQYEVAFFEPFEPTG